MSAIVIRVQQRAEHWTAAARWKPEARDEQVSCGERICGLTRMRQVYAAGENVALKMLTWDRTGFFCFYRVQGCRALETHFFTSYLPRQSTKLL